MLRLTDIKLPLDHDEVAIENAILHKLQITKSMLLETTVFKRGYDARNNRDIQLIYTLDVTVENEAALLEKFAKDTSVRVTPDMRLSLIHI